MSSEASDASLSSVSVAVRIRPMNHREKRRFAAPSVEVRGKTEVVIIDHGLPTYTSGVVTIQAAVNRTVLSNDQLRFNFDFAYDEDSSQEFLYDTSLKGLIENFVEGYNGCCFAYGSYSLFPLLTTPLM